MAAVTSTSRLRTGRRLAEACGVSLIGGLLLYIGVRYPSLASVGMGAGWVVLMTPAVVDRWRAPLVGFFPGLWLAMYALWTPLLKFSWYAYVLIVTLSLFHLLLQPLLAAWLHRLSGLPAFIVIPLAIGAAEWSRPLVGFSSFNMYQMGTSLHTVPVLMQAADLVGVLGLSVIWGVAWAVDVDLLRWLATGRPRAGRRVALSAVVAASAVLLFLVAYGVVQLSNDRSLEGPQIAIVQPNAPRGQRMTARAVAIQEQLTRDHIEQSVDLIVWPENAVLAVYAESPRYRQVVERVVRDKSAPLLFGAQGKDPESGRYTNSSFLVDRTGRIAGRNDKIVLYPFSERRAFQTMEFWLPPFKRLMTRLTQAAWGAAPNGIAGDHPVTMRISGRAAEWTFWTPICYEVCYADLARDAARRGSQFFINMTSEGWLGWGLNNNQMAVSMLRAVENRVGVVRVGNTGISCFIRPDGRVERYLRGERGRMLLDAGVLVHTVRTDPRAPTVYARWGGAIDLLWPVGWLSLAVFYGYRRLRGPGGRATPRTGRGLSPGPGSHPSPEPPRDGTAPVG